MAISEDASTPAAASAQTASGTLTVTSPSFSPPANSLLVAIVSIGHGPAGTPSITVSDSGSHTWTTGPLLEGGTLTWTAIYFTYLTTAPGSITVQAADSTSMGQGIQLDVRVVNGASSLQGSGNGAGSNTATGSSTSWTGSITTTVPGSWVYVAVAAAEESAAITPNGSTTTLNNFQASGGPSSQLSGRQSSATVTPGATTLGWTTTSAAITFSWAALEILPATSVPQVPPQSGLQSMLRRWRRRSQQSQPPYPIPQTIPGTTTLGGAGSITGAVTQDAGSATTLGGAGSITASPANNSQLGGQGSITGPDIIQGVRGTTLGAAASLATTSAQQAPATLNGTAQLNAPDVVLGSSANLAGTAQLSGSFVHYGQLHIVLLGGPAKVVTSTLGIVINPPAARLSGFAGTVSTFNITLPRPAFDPGGHVAHNPLNLTLPRVLLPLAGKVYHSVVSIVIPLPRMALAGKKNTAGPFNIVFGPRHGVSRPEAKPPEPPPPPGGRPRIIVKVR